GIRDRNVTGVQTCALPIWKVARLVAARFRGAFQPGNGFLETAQFDQVRANVVVRIAEFRIDFDGEPALGNGFFDAPLEMIRPAEDRKSVVVGKEGGSRGAG